MEGTAAMLIVNARRAAGLSQAELARRAGLTRSVVNAYERGRRDPGAGALASLVAAADRELVTRPAPGAVDLERAGRVLVLVIELAELLPFRTRRGIGRSPF